MTAEMKSAIEGIAHRTIAAWANRPFDHGECAGANRCLVVHPDDPIEPGEDGWDRFYGELTKELKLTGELPDDLNDEISELYMARFKAEWVAQVKACK
jgi:hypothetical protein